MATLGGRDELLALLPVPQRLTGLMDQTLSVLRPQHEGRPELRVVQCLHPRPYDVRRAPRVGEATTCLNAGSSEDPVVMLAEPKAAL